MQFHVGRQQVTASPAALVNSFEIINEKTGDERSQPAENEEEAEILKYPIQSNLVARMILMEFQGLYE